VGEVESAGPGVSLQGFQNRTGWTEGFPPPDRPSWALSALRRDREPGSRYLGFAAPAMPFRRLRGLPRVRRPDPQRVAGGRKASMGFDVPSRHTGTVPPESCAAPAAFMGFNAPTATSARRSTTPGFQPRFVPPSGFPTLLTVSSLRAFRPRGPVPLMGFTLQSFSPPQSRTSCDACALLPFLASRTLALRTRSSRCPAAPGRCSLRGSVPAGGRSLQRADALLGFMRLSRAFPSCRGTGFPVPSLLRFLHPAYGRQGGRRFRALTSVRVGHPSRETQLS
jgi:hypothetical protein